MTAIKIMKPALHLRWVLIVAFWLLSAALSADDHKEARRLVESGDILPLETLLGNLPQREKVSIIEVELEHKKGRWLYEIEVVDGQGIVREYLFDASDGRLLKEKVED